MKKIIKTKNIKDSKGFTLIELLVVIAIIGILSSVVLSSLSTARVKGQDTAIQSELSNMRAQAELYYGESGNKYSSTTPTTGPITCITSEDDLFGKVSENGLGELIDGIKLTYDASNPQCYASKVNWSVSATLPSGGSWCVDNTGKTGSTTMDTSEPYSCL